MPSGPPAEFGKSSLIALIIIESERLISLSLSEISHPHGLYAKRKGLTGSLLTEVCLGLVKILLNWLTDNKYEMCCLLG